jgi:hypothetical protein
LQTHHHLGNDVQLLCELHHISSQYYSRLYI